MFFISIVAFHNEQQERFPWHIFTSSQDVQYIVQWPNGFPNQMCYCLTECFSFIITLQYLGKLSRPSLLTRSTNVLVWLAVSFRTRGRLKLWKKFIHGKLIYGHLITSSCLLRCWLTMNDILAWPTAFYTGTSCLKITYSFVQDLFCKIEGRSSARKACHILVIQKSITNYPELPGKKFQSN